VSERAEVIRRHEAKGSTDKLFILPDRSLRFITCLVPSSVNVKDGTGKVLNREALKNRSCIFINGPVLCVIPATLKSTLQPKGSDAHHQFISCLAGKKSGQILF